MTEHAIPVEGRGLKFALAMCAAEIFGLIGFSTFQALIPTFQSAWQLSNADAGWISGVYFAGYVASVPVLTSLTDRIAPRHVLLCSLAVTALASLAFAWWAEGFWTAMFFRLLQGIGLAGTYMPGLKALTDAVEGSKQSRYLSFYTSSFGVGVAASFLLAGMIAPSFGWQWAFAVNALGAGVAAIIILINLPATAIAAVPQDHHVLDFRPVLRNRPAMGYIFAYCGHNWELFAFRAWAVAFLVFALGQDPDGGFGIDATIIAAALTLLGMPASILGNELAVRVGRTRAITIVAAVSVALSFVLGAAAGVSYALVVVLCLVYGALLTGDSAAITAGTVASAATGLRGATLAMHAFIGFMGGIFGPALAGIVLDLAGADSVFGWSLAIASMGVGSLAVMFAVRLASGRQAV
jgi:MFS family permease